MIQRPHHNHSSQLNTGLISSPTIVTNKLDVAVDSSKQNHQQQPTSPSATNFCPNDTLTNSITSQNCINNSNNICQSEQLATNSIVESSKKRKKRFRQNSPPVRNLSAYMFFANVHRHSVMKHFPDCSCPGITKILAAMWKEAPFEEKKVLLR